MTDRPIIFSGPMVRALLEGRKTMTRRLAWNNAGDRWSYWRRTRPGDRLWVRETWADVNTACGPGIGYRADSHFWQPDYDGEDFGAGPSFNYDKYPGNYSMWFDDLLSGSPDHGWRSPIHMYRWASRLTLVVTETKIERLQEISQVDAEAEGVKCDMSVRTFVDHFQKLWESLHGPDSWQENPEVVALTFEVHKCNIDAVKKAA